MPPTRSEAGLEAAFAESPIAALFGILKMLAFGWPGYLFANVSGPRKYWGGNNSHFWPWSKLFTPRQAPLIALSVAGLIIAAACIAVAVHAFGAATVALWYGIPYLVVNAHLVLITYLQHTDSNIPHYRAPAFTWLRGALSTVDRSFGPLLDDAFHHIADSHVVHHLFSTVRRVLACRLMTGWTDAHVQRLLSALHSCHALARHALVRRTPHHPINPADAVLQCRSRDAVRKESARRVLLERRDSNSRGGLQVLAKLQVHRGGRRRRLPQESLRGLDSEAADAVGLRMCRVAAALPVGCSGRPWRPRGRSMKPRLAVLRFAGIMFYVDST